MASASVQKDKPSNGMSLSKNSPVSEMAGNPPPAGSPTLAPIDPEIRRALSIGSPTLLDALDFILDFLVRFSNSGTQFAQFRIRRSELRLGLLQHYLLCRFLLAKILDNCHRVAHGG